MRISRYLLWPAAGLGLVAVAFAYGGRSRSAARVPIAASTRPAAAKNVADSDAAVTTFCGGCHKMPDPAYFSQELWFEEVRRGFFLHAISSRRDLTPPPQLDAIKYFRARSPEKLELPAPENLPADSVRFVRTDAQPSDPSSTAMPSISSLRRVPLNPDESPTLLACDMASGDLLAIDPATAEPTTRRLAKVGNPAHVEACDLDADGATDLVVADLGSFLPADHSQGRVVWLRNTGGAEYEATTLLENIGRVADARPGDFDGDGDEDLIVAEFGWHSTGAIRLLTNDPAPDGTPRFTARTVDSRHGTIHVPVLDWNGDARPDFVALISQEYETAELFLNQGGGEFRRETVTPPEDPAFGSSGIEPADLDGDGDQDLLYTNGDTFDSHELKPFHGIRWSENRGEAGWVTHHLTAMPGVHRAMAADLDGDGDQDIAASALVTEQLTERGTVASGLDSVIWLEQVRPGEFVRHGLERGLCHHAAMELGDFDSDGRVDIAVGNFREPKGRSPVRIWRNLAAGPAAAASEPVATRR